MRSVSGYHHRETGESEGREPLTRRLPKPNGHQTDIRERPEQGVFRKMRPSMLRELDRWVRRRLRAVGWKQWKRVRTRFAELHRRGVGKHLAAQTDGSACVAPSP
jgi:Group II intron, maturase-specific domain